MSGPSSSLDAQLERSVLGRQPVIITIDGPAGTGKSSVSRLLAERLGLDFLDTGAMYRAAAAIAIDHGIEVGEIEALVSKVASADLHFDWTADPPTILAWEKPIDHRIRDADVTGLVSQFAAIGLLREHLVKKQRIIGSQHPRLVTEGRDQGSVVFPDAALKVYLDASPEVRAARRAEQLHEGGGQQAILLKEIIERDRLDSTRSDGPLICPEDAQIVDTSEMTFDQVVETLEALARERVAAL